MESEEERVSGVSLINSTLSFGNFSCYSTFSRVYHVYETVGGWGEERREREREREKKKKREEKAVTG
jgi:hypothetical protein